MSKRIPKVSIVILNYNTWSITIEEIKNIEKVLSYDDLEVIIVDNCSTNNSFEELRSYVSANSFKYDYKLVKSERNGGYAAGNNVGIKESIKSGSEFSLIINNDILFTSADTIEKLVQIMDEDRTVGAISPRIVSQDGTHDKPIYYKKPTFWDMSFGICSFVKNIQIQNDELVYQVYAPRGSCMFLRNDDLQRIGFLDEGTFLYYEEPILAEKLMGISKGVLNLGTVHVIHNHAKTIKTNVSRRENRRIVVQSMDYYMRKYRGFNFVQRFICRFIRKYAYLVSNK